MTSSEEEEGTQEVEQVTQSYQSRAHRLATLFIMTAGSANASQFPMMFIVYGGVPFLLAYLAFLGAVAFPLMRLEGNLGQFAGDGNRGIFSTVPLFIGLGYTMSLYAIVHMVGDSVPVSDQLLYLVDSLRDATWNDCPTGLLLAPNRTCYVPRHAFSLCRIARARLMEAFRRQSFSHGVPAVAEGPDFSVVLVPPKVYRHEMAGCLPAVYNYLQPYQPRRHAGWFEDGWPALSEIRAEPILSLAAIWMVVFALAHHGFTTVKRTMYVMVFLHVCTTFLLLVRGVTLPGAMSGLGMLLYSDWSYAVNFEMWSHALYVSLESVGVTGSIYLGIVRFNNFKNDYHRDVNFVLVADTASKGLRMAITFMFLGHLASSIGIDVRMLVGIESHLIVGIMPQAMSVVPYQELWSQVHSLWLLSTMLPKFLIMPDIVIEVLAPAQPFVLLNRTLIHFFICVSLLLISIVVCSPGGANIAAIIVHNHDQNVRFVVLLLESIVFLQFCGLRRLDIASRIMTGRECSVFVKVCLASVIPVITITLLSVKLLSKHSGGGHYPIWIYAVITWFDVVQLSCIPVFAIVFMYETELDLDNCLLPLPTWVPVNWEQAMYYRKTLVVEGFDSDARNHPPPPPRKRAQSTQRPPSKKRAATSSDSSSSSSTEFMGSAFVVASDRMFVQPGTETRRARRAKPSAPSGVCSLSGTVHVSRHLSSVRQCMIREMPAAEEADQRNSKVALARRAERLAKRRESDVAIRARLASNDEATAPTSDDECCSSSASLKAAQGSVGAAEVAMPLASDTEAGERPQPCAVSQMVASRFPTIKQNSQMPAVAIPASAALADQREKVSSPEASIVSHEVPPVGEAHDELQKKDERPGEQGTQPAPSDKQPVYEGRGAAFPAQKTPLDINLTQCGSYEAIRRSGNVHDAQLALKGKSKQGGEKLEKSSDQGADRPGAPKLLPDHHEAAYDAKLSQALDEKRNVCQDHAPAGVVPTKTRLSVQEMLMQNKALPMSPTEGLLSNMYIRVLEAPNAPCAATTLPVQHEQVAGTKTTIGATAGEKTGRPVSLEQPQEQPEPGEPELREPSVAGGAEQQPSKAKLAKGAALASTKHRHTKRHKPKHVADKVAPGGEHPLAEERGAQPREEGNRQSDNVPGPELACQEKLKEHEEELLPQQPMLQGAHMSGAFSLAVPDHVVADGSRLPDAAEEKKEVGQEHVQATSLSKKPRLSVQAMLFQNIALPISPTDGGVLSDMCIRVSGAPNASGSNPTLMGQREEVAGTELGVGLGELKDVTGNGKQASVKGTQGQQGLRESGELKPKEPLAAGRGGQHPGRASPKLAYSAKSITAGSSKPHRAKHSKNKQAAGKNADQRRKQALYKPAGALVPVDIDAPHTTVPPKTENLQQGVQGAADSASAAQEHIPELMKAKRRSVGQDNETPSKRSSKSLDSAGRASTVHVPAALVEEKPQGRTVIGTEVPRATYGDQQVHPARVDLTAEAKVQKESKQKRQKKEKKQKKGKSRAVSPS